MPVKGVVAVPSAERGAASERGQAITEMVETRLRSLGIGGVTDTQATQEALHAEMTRNPHREVSQIAGAILGALVAIVRSRS
ncbi:hypothetical protein A2412_04220 [Candidatus Peribacteria bacterium RIFOXYC1_FULL_58_8]|nr:MAG: hypothetical protein A2398_03760 [Candidatus Peribacteria bacterium RIFOXYB1_FULL_57_12]OGJ80410.1 MAG: hypothetical protein A2412_04220 [Candidatus Peribacteria bacterium RIFOXYC1_FULL_58_8]